MLVLIADDHALLREGMIMLLRDAHPEWRFAEAASFDDVLGKLGDGPVDLLLIDLGMPGMDGGRTLQALREVYPDSRVAVLTGMEDRATILDCLGAGVHGYLLKSDTAENMLSAVETIMSGGVYVPIAVTRVLGSATAPPDSVRPPLSSNGKPNGLTPRQTDVMMLLAEGHSTKDIARRLNLGLGTVKVHLAGVYRALGASNRMEAMVRAGRLKLSH